VTGVIVWKMASSGDSVDEQVAEEPIEPEVMGDEDEKENGKGGEEIVRVVVEEKSLVSVRTSPDKEGEIIKQFSETTEVKKVEEFKDFVLIAFTNDGLELILEGWVEGKYIEEGEQNEDIEEKGEVVILETGTGWLRVRTAPGGAELTKVEVDEEFTLVGVKDGWYEIDLGDETGWVSKEYVELKTD
jgi:uncharacterized protein YgiM (DUF1202 family)